MPPHPESIPWDESAESPSSLNLLLARYHQSSGERLLFRARRGRASVAQLSEDFLCFLPPLLRPKSCSMADPDPPPNPGNGSGGSKPGDPGTTPPDTTKASSTASPTITTKATTAPTSAGPSNTDTDKPPAQPTTPTQSGGSQSSSSHHPSTPHSPTTTVNSPTPSAPSSATITSVPRLTTVVQFTSTGQDGTTIVTSTATENTMISDSIPAFVTTDSRGQTTTLAFGVDLPNPTGSPGSSGTNGGDSNSSSGASGGDSGTSAVSAAKKGSNTGALAGGVVGGLLALLLIIGALVVYRRRRRNRSYMAPSSEFLRNGASFRRPLGSDASGAESPFQRVGSSYDTPGADMPPIQAHGFDTARGHSFSDLSHGEAPR